MGIDKATDMPKNTSVTKSSAKSQMTATSKITKKPRKGVKVLREKPSMVIQHKNELLKNGLSFLDCKKEISKEECKDIKKKADELYENTKKERSELEEKYDEKTLLNYENPFQIDVKGDIQECAHNYVKNLSEIQHCMNHAVCITLYNNICKAAGILCRAEIGEVFQAKLNLLLTYCFYMASMLEKERELPPCLVLHDKMSLDAYDLVTM